MTKFLPFVLLLLVCCAKPPAKVNEDYFGILKVNDYSVRLYLRYQKGKPQLTVIGYRGERVPVRNISAPQDSISFVRVRTKETFKGVYNNQSRSITGTWTTEDHTLLPLTFVPTVPDTITGLHPRKTKEYQYERPPDLNDQILSGDRKDQRMNSSLLDSLMREITREKYGYIHSVLIARNNHLIVEEYFYNFSRKSAYGIQSATKSFVSALTGIALSEGEIPSVQTPLCNYLPTYRDVLCNEQNKTITLDQLMSMTTGLEWDEITHIYGDKRNTAMIASNTPDEFRYLLTRPRSDKKTFAYNSLNHTLMNNVLKESTGLDNAAELKQRLMDPLGISEYDPGEMHNGILGDIFVRPRDMLKFGLMYLDSGRWNGKQIVPKSWVKMSTTDKTQAIKGLGYGYFWWTKSFTWSGKPIKSYFAWGFGGQFIFVVPELQLVAVFTGSNWNTDPTKYYMEVMGKYVVGGCE